MNINATLLGQFISIAMFAFFCWKFIWPPIIAATETRQKKIADGLAAAERGEHEQELAEQRAKNLIREAKDQAAEIIAQANKRGNEMVEKAKTAARVEGERIKASAQAEIDQELNIAKEALREHVVIIAISGAEKILKREVDAKTHQNVLNDLVSQV